jgi:hypothetical protein
MGHPENITNETFEKAATAEKQPVAMAKRNTLELLAKELGYEIKKKEQA